MGFKNFYLGFKSFFGECISSLKPVGTNVLIIELNGLFYHGCKKVYAEHGQSQDVNKNKLQMLLFEEICNCVHSIILEYPSSNTIFLVVDGIPGLMKNIEQRQRRYKNSFENKYGNIFDLNSFSPGTKLLHYLTKYIDWFLRKQITTDSSYRNKKIYFSNEKVAGEGEIKILNFIKHQCTVDDNIMICSSDSDLIVLSLVMMNYNINIARNSTHYGKEYLSIQKFRQHMYEKFSFESTEKEQTFLDIFLLFILMGNDYVPNSPCIYHFEILYRDILPLYQQNKKHFVSQEKPHILNIKHLCDFFVSLAQYEEKWIQDKYKAQSCSFFPDSIYLNLTTHGDSFDFSSYQNSFRHSNAIHQNTVVEYLCTLQNIINMIGNHNFQWFHFFRYYKAPFLSDFVYSTTLEEKVKLFIRHLNTTSFDPLFHLSIILPPQSKNLLPKSMQHIFLHLKDYYPSYIEIDLTGKFKIWEGIVKLPIINTECFLEYYSNQIDSFEHDERKRNLPGKTFFYKHKHCYWKDFHSYYGIIPNCRVKTIFLDI